MASVLSLEAYPDPQGAFRSSLTRTKALHVLNRVTVRPRRCERMKEIYTRISWYVILPKHRFWTCTGFGPGLLAGVSKTRWRRAQARRTRARTPHACPMTLSSARSTLTYSTGDSNMLDNVNINVNINVNAPDGAGLSPGQPSAQPPTHVPPRPDMPARCRSRVAHRGAR